MAAAKCPRGKDKHEAKNYRTKVWQVKKGVVLSRRRAAGGRWRKDRWGVISEHPAMTNHSNNILNDSEYLNVNQFQ